MEKNSIQFPNSRISKCVAPRNQYHNQPKPIIPPPLEVILSQPLTPAHDVTALEDAIHHPGSEIMFLDASLQYLLHTLHTQLQVGLNGSQDKGYHGDPFSPNTNNIIYSDDKPPKKSVSIPDVLCAHGKNVGLTENHLIHDYCGFSSQFKPNNSNLDNKTINETTDIMRNMCNDRGLKPYFNTLPFRSVAATIPLLEKKVSSPSYPCYNLEKCSKTKTDYVKEDKCFSNDQTRKRKEDEEGIVNLCCYKVENVCTKHIPEEKVKSPDTTGNTTASVCEEATNTAESPLFLSFNTKKNFDQSVINYSERNVLIPQSRQHACPLVDSILLNRSTTTSIARENACHKSRPPYPIQEYNDRRVPRSFVTPHVSGPSDASICSDSSKTGSDFTVGTEGSLENSNTPAQFSNISSIFAFMNPILNKDSTEKQKSNKSNHTFCLADKDGDQTELKEIYNKKLTGLGLPCMEAKSKRFDRFQSCFDVKKPVTDLIHKDSVAGMFDNSPAIYFRHEFDKGIIMQDNNNCADNMPTNKTKPTVKSPNVYVKSDASTQYSDSLEIIPNNIKMKTANQTTQVKKVSANPILVQRNPFQGTENIINTFKYDSPEPESLPRPFFVVDKSLSTISEERTVSTASDGIKAELPKIKEEFVLTRPCQSRQCSRKSLRRINSLQKVQEIFHNNRFASSVSSFASETKSRFTCRIKGSKIFNTPIIGVDRGPFPLPNDGRSVEYEWNKEEVGNCSKNHVISNDPKRDESMMTLPTKNKITGFKHNFTTLKRDELHTRIEEIGNDNSKHSADTGDRHVSQHKTYNVDKSGDCGGKIFTLNIQNPSDTNTKNRKEGYCFENYINPTSFSWNKNDTRCVAYANIKPEYGKPLYEQQSGGEYPRGVTNCSRAHTPIKHFSHSTEEIPIPEKYAFNWPKTSKINKDYLSRSKVYHRQSIDMQKAVRFDENNISGTARNVGGRTASPFEWSFIKKDPRTKCPTLPDLEEKHHQEGEMNKEHTATRRDIGKKESDLSTRKLVPRFEWHNMFKSPRSLYSNVTQEETKPKKLENHLHEQLKVSRDTVDKHSSDQNRKSRPVFEWHNLFKRPRSASFKNDQKLLKRPEEDNFAIRDSFEHNATRRSAIRPCVTKPMRSRSSSTGATRSSPRQSNQIQEEKRSILKQSKRYPNEMNQDSQNVYNERSRLDKPLINELYSMKGNSNSAALGYSRLSPYYQQWLAKRHRPAPKFTQENLEEFKKKIVLPPNVQQHYEAKEKERKLFEEHSRKNKLKIKGNIPCKRKFKSYFNAS